MLSKQPCIVKSNPRNIDLLLINEENIVDSSKYLSQCSGIVLNLDDLPDLNDAEIDALLV